MGNQLDHGIYAYQINTHTCDEGKVFGFALIFKLYGHDRAYSRVTIVGAGANMLSDRRVETIHAASGKAGRSD